MATFGGRSYKQDEPRGDAPRDDRGEGGYPPDDPRGGEREAPREEPREERPRDDRPRDDRPRDDRPRDDRPRDDYRGGGRGGRGGGRGGYSGGRGGGGGNDPNYAFLGYLYGPSRKGGFSVFLKRDMIDILRELTEDDIIGISPTERGGWSIWARKVDEAEKEDYRNGGGRGGGRGRR